MWRSLALALSLVAAAASGQPPAGRTLLTETFDQPGGLPAGWVATGATWQLVDGRLRVDDAKGLAQLVLSLEPLENVAIEADVTFESALNNARWLALTARITDDSFMLFTHRFDRSAPNGLEIARGVGSLAKIRWQVLRAKPGQIGAETGVSHHLRLEVQGRTARGFMDGAEVLVERLPESVAGRVGLTVSSVSATFDNLKVEALDPPTEPTQAELREQLGAPLVIAHRGNSAHAPENTLVSMREAYEAGASVVEIDVRKTKEGHLIALHDATFRRTTGHDGKPEDMTLEEIRALDAGSWKDPKYAGERIPTIIEMLDHAKQVDGAVQFDLKETGLTADIAKLIIERGMEDQVLLGPWQPAEAAEARRNFPYSPVTLIGSAPASFGPNYFLDLKKQGVSGFSTNAGSLSPAFVRGAARSGMPVFAWTVNDPAVMLELRRIGVAGIVTDDPALCVRTLSGE